MFPEDAEILSLIRKNELKGYEFVFRKYYAEMWQISVSVLRSKEAAEDVVQQLFLTLCREDSLRNIKQNLPGYLMQSVKNASFNYIRQHAQSRSQSLEDIFAETETPESLLIKSDLRREIEDHLSLLPPKCRSIFQQKYLLGKSYREIAKEQNISLATVDSHLSKALRLLRQKIVTFPKS